jgi:DNA-binding MarR family transcriptional regulator
LLTTSKQISGAGLYVAQSSTPAGSGRAAARPPGSDLATRLELTFRLLGKRIYLASGRQLRAVSPGLDKASVSLLATLEEHDDARPSDVAAAAGLDLSTVSRQLRQLERLGLVTRRPDGVDGRACRMSLTPQGQGCLSAVRSSRAAMLDEVFRDWPDAERRHLLSLLDRLLAGLTAPQATTVPPPGGAPLPMRESHA